MKIVVNLLKSVKIDKEPIRINTTKTDKNRQKTTKIVQNSSPNRQKSLKSSEIGNKSTSIVLKTDLKGQFSRISAKIAKSTCFQYFAQLHVRTWPSIPHIRIKKNILLISNSILAHFYSFFLLENTFNLFLIKK